jgi:hypothetical protein
MHAEQGMRKPVRLMDFIGRACDWACWLFCWCILSLAVVAIFVALFCDLYR